MRKGSSTSTARRRPIDNQFLLRLQQLPNAIVTPHTAYYTSAALYDTVEQTLDRVSETSKGAATT